VGAQGALPESNLDAALVTPEPAPELVVQRYVLPEQFDMPTRADGDERKGRDVESRVEESAPPRSEWFWSIRASSIPRMADLPRYPCSTTSRWHDLCMRVIVRRAGYHRHQLIVGGRVKRTYPSRVQAVRAGATLVASKRGARSSRSK
jgi:hypothetical protein